MVKKTIQEGTTALGFCSRDVRSKLNSKYKDTWISQEAGWGSVGGKLKEKTAEIRGILARPTLYRILPKVDQSDEIPRIGDFH